MRTAFLSSARIDLVHIEPCDAAALTAGVNNHTITRYVMLGSFPVSQTFEEEWIKKLYQNNERDLVLGIWVRDDQGLIGTAGLHRINQRDQIASLGIMIFDASYHGRGIGTEVVTLLLKHAFGRLNLRQVRLSVLGNNPRAARCYEKCGFRVIGTYPESIFKEGAFQDEILMAAYRT